MSRQSRDTLSDIERRRIAITIVTERLMDTRGRPEGHDGPCERTDSCLPRLRWAEIDDLAELHASEANHVRNCRFCTVVARGISDEEADTDQVPEVVEIPPKSKFAAGLGAQLLHSVPLGDLTLELRMTEIRNDVMVELKAPSDRPAPADGRVYLIRLSSENAPVAVFCDGSPVFTSVKIREVVRNSTSVESRHLFPWTASSEDLAFIERSRWQLLDEALRVNYDEFLEDAGLDVDSES